MLEESVEKIETLETRIKLSTAISLKRIADVLERVTGSTMNASGKSRNFIRTSR